MVLWNRITIDRSEASAKERIINQPGLKQLLLPRENDTTAITPRVENFSPAIIALIHLLESRGFPRFSGPILLGYESTTRAKLELREADASVFEEGR